MTSAHDTHRATENDAGPVPEANRPGHRPEVDQDKPFDKFASLAARADSDTGADQDEATASPAERRSSWVLRALPAIVAVVALGWLLGRALVRRRTSRTDHLVHTVRSTMVDTVDHVKDTVDHVKDALDHVKDAVAHGKDRLPG